MDVSGAIKKKNTNEFHKKRFHPYLLYREREGGVM